VKTPAPTPSLEEFLACCDAECGFLVREFGFARLEAPREYNPYSVCFRKGPLGVDVFGESWGQSASCELVRGEDSLYLGLMVPVEHRPKRAHPGAPAGQLDQVRTIAMRLKLHAADFLSGDLRRFEAALAEWKRVTRPREISEAQRLDRLRLQAVTAAGHASRRADHAEVVRLLQPYADSLSLHQRRMLEMALERLKSKG
jgi:hypothetical protein